MKVRFEMLGRLVTKRKVQNEDCEKELYKGKDAKYKEKYTKIRRVSRQWKLDRRVVPISKSIS